MDGDGGSSFYAAIPALLDALGDNNARISLMTAMNASRPSPYGFPLTDDPERVRADVARVIR